MGGVLASRALLFVLVQAALAVAFSASGRDDAWRASAAWWPLVATVVNFVSIGLLVFLLRREGASYVGLFREATRAAPRKLALTLGVLLVAAVVVVLPSLWISLLLWGDVERGTILLFQPLPLWAVWVSFALFPVTVALAELPTYFGYARPRLVPLVGSSNAAVLVAAGALSLQHAALPLLLDWKFAAWRAIMFLPLALVLGWMLERRPRMMPYLVALHALLDFAAVWPLYVAATM